MDQVKKEDLTTLIEKLYSQWEHAKEDDKPFLASQVEKYALKYKEITGEWFMREIKASDYQI